MIQTEYAGIKAVTICFISINPDGDQWGNLHWGHAVSEDCVHWNSFADCSGRRQGNWERSTVFPAARVRTGSAPFCIIRALGVRKTAETAERAPQQWCAVSEDGMTTWKKYQGNPIMTAEIHGNLNVLEWRDPYVWKEEDGWYMVLGAEVEGRGSVLLYHSPDPVSLGILSCTDAE